MSSRRGIRRPPAAPGSGRRVQRVVRARARLGVVLHRRRRARRAARAPRPCGRRGSAAAARPRRSPSPSAPGSSASSRRLAARAEHGEAVVLGGDLDPPGLEVLDRVVGAAVAERQLEGLEPHRPAEQLVAEADAPDGHLAHQVRARCPRRSRARPGRRGRWRGRRRRAARASSSSAPVEHGCSSSRAPRSRRLRTIESLMPVSIADHARARVVRVEDHRLARA